jgi:hypothetical protein
MARTLSLWIKTWLQTCSAGEYRNLDLNSMFCSLISLSSKNEFSLAKKAPWQLGSWVNHPSALELEPLSFAPSFELWDRPHCNPLLPGSRSQLGKSFGTSPNW